MRLASIKDGSRDGQLVIVSHDGLKCVSVPAIGRVPARGVGFEGSEADRTRAHR